MQIGKLQSKVTSVSVFDFDAVNEHLKLPVMGIVGMSVLRETCIRCDFDAEQLSLTASEPEPAGERAEIFFAEGGRPHVILSIGRRSFPVMIDLGSELGLKIPPQVFDSIDTKPLFTLQQSVSVNGVSQNLGYKSVSVALGKQTVESVFVERGTEEYGLAGLKFLCRFNLLLNLPAKELYVSRSKRFQARDNATRFGLSERTYHGDDAQNASIIGFLAKGSPAQSAGIRLGDLILSAKSEYYGERRGEEMFRMLGLPRIGPTTIEVLRDREPLRFVVE